jgi:hypothetical protein
LLALGRIHAGHTVTVLVSETTLAVELGDGDVRVIRRTTTRPVRSIKCQRPRTATPVSQTMCCTSAGGHVSRISRRITRGAAPTTIPLSTPSALPNYAVLRIKRRRCAAPGPALPAPGSGLGEAPPGAPAPSQPRRAVVRIWSVGLARRGSGCPVLVALDCPGPGCRVQGACGVAAAIGLRRPWTRQPLARFWRLSGGRGQRWRTAS